MYAYIELSNIAQTDAIIQSLSWMNSKSTSSTDLTEGWLATGNKNHIVSITYTSIKSDENCSMPDRTNFNLRAHHTSVRRVSWNIPYGKLTTIDEKGVIFVWIKHENRWSLELINDRNHSVIDMSWSYDGRMTVICYEDGFVLVGSVTGQRYWSTILNIPQAKVSAVTWMPDISHVILGTTLGQLIIIDHHGNTREILPLTTKSIRQLLYSCDKYYPDAPDTNARKFVNDDYILACALENGQILLLNHCHDPAPITIETNLQNIQIDWSHPDQILVVGGYQRLNDIHYNNQILFYNRRGEYLCRLHIPEMTQPLTALCWAHGNGIVFVACGVHVYAIWVIHKSFPSMLTLCQMKIKESLLKNSLENLDKIFVPSHLKINLFNLYRSAIKGFIPNQKSLHTFVCNPLKSSLRLQCTMKRVDKKKDTNPSAVGAIYVLYLEYLGGLIPLLTAKRISKVCPKFIIFNPDVHVNDLLLKSSSRKLNPPMMKNFSLFKQRTNIFPNNDQNSIYVAETDRENLIKTNDCSLENTNNMNSLCTITGNVWGTHFKFHGHSTHLPEIVGSVKYKISFLHLQPRQMTVKVAVRQQKLVDACSAHRVQDTSVDLQQINVEPSTISPINISRPISPAVSIPNFIRPISPPCIQVKEPLSPRISRACSTIITHPRDSSPPISNDVKLVSNVLENCFEPETYRNLCPLNSNQQKRLSFSDPTLNHIRKTTNSPTIDEYFSVLSSNEQIPNDDDDDEIENLSSDEQQTLISETPICSNNKSQIDLNPCQINDSLITLSPSSDLEQHEISYYTMKNRPPVWNEQTQVYQLDFGGRVTLESAKNFQIELNGKQVIQFGRIENNSYTLDFEWPYSPLQAFAVALANITQRLK